MTPESTAEPKRWMEAVRQAPPSPFDPREVETFAPVLPDALQEAREAFAIWNNIEGFAEFDDLDDSDKDRWILALSTYAAHVCAERDETIERWRKIFYKEETRAADFQYKFRFAAAQIKSKDGTIECLHKRVDEYVAELQTLQQGICQAMCYEIDNSKTEHHQLCDMARTALQRVTK